MRRVYVLMLVVFTLASFLVVFIPAFLIRPFVSQSAQGLALSYQMRALSPVVTLVFWVPGILIAWRLWRFAPSITGKVATGFSILVLTAAAVLSRQNHFEWIFNPLPKPGYIEVSKASHVKDSEMVLGVRSGNEARAYPVQIMAYHHLTNDVVGGQPIVVTY